MLCSLNHEWQSYFKGIIIIILLSKPVSGVYIQTTYCHSLIITKSFIRGLTENLGTLLKSLLLLLLLLVVVLVFLLEQTSTLKMIWCRRWYNLQTWHTCWKFMARFQRRVRFGQVRLGPVVKVRFGPAQLRLAFQPLTVPLW